MTTGSAHVRDVTEATFQQEVIERSRQAPVVVDFWAAWCGPCRMLGPVLERLAVEGGGDWELVKVDTDANPRIAQQYRIQGIPAVKAFRDGRVVDEFTGALPEPQVRAWLRGIVPSRADRLASQGEGAEARGDAAGAEAQYRQALAEDRGHGVAGAALARLLLERGALDEARSVLAALPNDPRVERVRALLRLKDTGQRADIDALKARLQRNPGDVEAHHLLGIAYAADEAYTAALDHLLEAVTIDRKAGDAARRTMIDLFNLLGDDDPRTRDYRTRLSAVLF